MNREDLSRRNQVLYKMIMTALFAALSFVGTVLQARIPTGGFTHFGNFFCILGGLLCGGLVGGFSGALGMGLYDLLFYPSTLLRTLIAKFLMGFITATVFHRFVKSKKNPKPALLSTFFLSGAVSIACWILYFIPVAFSFGDKERTISASVWLVAFSTLFFLILTFALIFAKKLKKTTQAVVFSSTIGIIINILCEMSVRVATEMIAGAAFTSSFLYAVSKVPAAVLNGITTIVCISLIYYPLYRATYSLNRLDDLGIESYERGV